MKLSSVMEYTEELTGFSSGKMQLMLSSAQLRDTFQFQEWTRDVIIVRPEMSQVSTTSSDLKSSLTFL